MLWEAIFDNSLAETLFRAWKLFMWRKSLIRIHRYAFNNTHLMTGGRDPPGGPGPQTALGQTHGLPQPPRDKAAPLRLCKGYFSTKESHWCTNTTSLRFRFVFFCCCCCFNSKQGPLTRGNNKALHLGRPLCLSLQHAGYQG